MRILVADDDTSCRLVVKAVVERLGHECIAVNDGARAWEALQADPIDVLITDWMMPGLDGPELCRRVRGSDAHGYTYVILATSLTDRDDVIAGMEAGADDYLTKPLDPFDVQTRLIAATRVTALHRQIVEFRTELENLNIKFAEQARTDPLTQLANRLRLHEDLEAVQQRARRGVRPYAIAICDLDHFKNFNDSNGHLAGDDALRRVATAIATGCRGNDRAYRYGGEEFVIVFEDEGLAGAIIAADRLRRGVEVLGIPQPGTGSNGSSGVMTISVGLAAWEPASDLSPEGVLDLADAALYDAKARGRNQVATPTLNEVAEPRMASASPKPEHARL